MASVGQAIITAVLWFQFLTSQVIAIVMLSTSISDEIYKRTLGTLMTTPIRSFQIVVGQADEQAAANRAAAGDLAAACWRWCACSAAFPGVICCAACA